MAEIYFRDANGCKVFVQVSDEVSDAMTEYRRAEWRGEANARNHNVSLQALEEVGVFLCDNAADPLQILMEKETEQEHRDKLKRLKAALATLPKQQLDLLVLIYKKKLSLKEISEKLGITYQSVQDRRDNILKKLKKIFD